MASAIEFGRPYWILHPVSCHTPEAAATTVSKCSWGWTQKASETCRALLQLLINIMPSCIGLVLYIYFNWILTPVRRKGMLKIRYSNLYVKAGIWCAAASRPALGTNSSLQPVDNGWNFREFRKIGACARPLTVMYCRASNERNFASTPYQTFSCHSA